MPVAQTVAVPLELPHSSGGSALASLTLKMLFKPGFCLTNAAHRDVIPLLSPGTREVQVWDQPGQISTVLFWLQPPETAFPSATSVPSHIVSTSLISHFLLFFFWKWRLTKDIFCNLALQAVIEQEADAKPVWARILGAQGRTVSERPGLSPTGR